MNRSERSLVACLTLAEAVVLAFIAVTCIKPPGGHYDFNLRMNEAACVARGVNPYDVWHGDVVLKPYVPNFGVARSALEGKDGFTEDVNAYVPWVYTCMMPLAVLPREVAWALYSLLMLASIMLIFRFSLPRAVGWRAPGGFSQIAAIPLAMVSYLLWSNASVGNLIVFVLAASVLMARTLEDESRWILAGAMWAIAMVKPQSAILFAVPLLMRGRWKVCMVAGALCLLASVPPAVMCRSSLFDMLIQGPAANAGLFNGCGTWPKFLCGRLFGGSADIGIGLAIGAALCVWMTWLLRRERDWLVYLMPAAICASCWTYTQAYSHAMGWFVAYAVVGSLVEHPRSKFLWTLSVVSVPVLSRAFLAWHGFCAFFGMSFPMSEYAFRSIDSLNSTASLAVAVAYCVWKHLNSPKPLKAPS